MLDSLAAMGLPATEPGAAEWIVEEVADAIHPKTIRLLDYYRSLPCEGGLPCRRDLEPSAVAGLLDSVFIGERDEAGEIRYRLVGSEIETRTRTAATGALAGDLYTSAGMARLNARYQRVLDRHERIILRGHVAGIGIDHVTYEATMLPMWARDKGAKLVIGGLFTLDGPAPARA